MQARARRTREKILSQAKRAFAERGFEATNLTEHILTPAGVSVGSFYHQFSNKREVLLEIFDHTITARHERLGERIRNHRPTSFGDAYRDVLVALFDDADRDPDVWFIQWREYESPDPMIQSRSLIGIERWIDIVLALMAPWYGADHPRRHDAARMVVLLGMSVVRQYCHMDPSERPQLRSMLLDPAVTFAQAGCDRILNDDA